MNVLFVHDKNVAREAAPAAPLGTDNQIPQGGIGVYLAQTAQGLKARGHVVSWARLIAHRAPIQTPPADSISVRTSAFRPGSKTRRQLGRFLDQQRIDVVHLHGAIDALSPRTLADLARLRPTVCTVHDVSPVCYWQTKLHPDGTVCDDPLGRTCLTSGCFRVGHKDGVLRDSARVWMKPRQLRQLRRLPLVIAPSEYLRNLLMQNGFDSANVMVLRHYSRFEAEIGDRDDPPSTVDQQVGANILCVTRLVSEKGVLHFIKALALIEDRKWNATIVGDGPLWTAAMSLAQQKNQTHRIRFLAEADATALQHLYEQCRFVTLPSLIPESFGLVGIEAMSFGKPVVAFPSGGIAEWLRDGVNGLAASHGSVEDLAGRMASLLDEPDLCLKLGQQGKALLLKEFNKNQHLDGLLAAYHRVMGRTLGESR